MPFTVQKGRSPLRMPPRQESVCADFALVAFACFMYFARFGLVERVCVARFGHLAWADGASSGNRRLPCLGERKSKVRAAAGDG